METTITNTTLNKSLSLYPIDYPFESLVTRAKEIVKGDVVLAPKLILNPEFQRKYKWNKDNEERTSAFIESCLMRIPLPACYFAEKEDGRHEVIDGVQRITTIMRFFNNEFALEGLSVFTELEGKKFSELDSSLQSDLENTTIRCIILRKENSRSIIKEIFARLNRGAVELSAQEIRHAIYDGNLDKLLSQLADDAVIQEFGLGANSTQERNSREGDEMVLRFFALQTDLQDYEKNKGDNFAKYLDRFMEKHQNIDDSTAAIWEKLFLSTLEKCKLIFGDKVFANVAKQGERQNMPLYDSVMWVFAKYSLASLQEHQAIILKKYTSFCESEEYNKLIYYGVHREGILKRRNLWDSLLSDLPLELDKENHLSI